MQNFTLSLQTFKQFAEMTKSYEEINEKIRKGKAVVLTAEEVSEMARTMAPKEILEKVDVVTTATFGSYVLKRCLPELWSCKSAYPHGED